MHHFPTPQQQRLPHATSGVSLLIVIIILGSALLVISTGAIIIGLSVQESGMIGGRGGEARALADGCMNEAYLRITRDASWGLSGMLPFTAPNGSCTIQVVDLGAGRRQIDIIGTVTSYTTHIRSTYSRSTFPSTIESWEERTD